MNRKDFLSLAGMGMISTSFDYTRGVGEEGDALPIIPALLKKGDTIGICSPAGTIKREEIEPAIERLRAWGYEVMVGDSVGKRDFIYGGTDEERKTDLQQMLDHPNIKAILCARGGYGLIRIIDELNWDQFKKKPKWVIGFSDVTVLHAHLNRRLGIASIHSKMCNSFPSVWDQADTLQQDTILSINKILSGERMSYQAAYNTANRLGEAKGILIGGNLKTIETMAGSASDIYTRGKILFVEDTQERLYSIDRMFWNLKRSGKLSGLKGLIVGGFKVTPDDDPESVFGHTIEEIVTEKIKDYRYPVCFDFPVGHQRNNYALKCGGMHTLQVQSTGTILTGTI